MPSRPTDSIRPWLRVLMYVKSYSGWLLGQTDFEDQLCFQCSGEIDPAVPFFDHFLSQCSSQSMPNMDKLLQTLGTELIFDFDWLR